MMFDEGFEMDLEWFVFEDFVFEVYENLFVEFFEDFVEKVMFVVEVVID